MSEIGLDVGLANDLKMAFRRNDYTLEEIQMLKEGDILGLVLGILRGTHASHPVKRTIDLGKTPTGPVGWKPEIHSGSGIATVHVENGGLYLNGVKVELQRNDKQRHAEFATFWNGICSSGMFLNANVLEFLVKHPAYWPAEWKQGKSFSVPSDPVFFLGTLFWAGGCNGSLRVASGRYFKGKVIADYNSFMKNMVSCVAAANGTLATTS